MKKSSETRQVLCDQRTLEYELIRKPVKNINLRVKADGKITVSANNRVPVEYIESFLKEKQDFIIRALDKFAKRREHISALPREYVSGETFYILGKSLQLKVIEAKEETIISDGEFIYLSVKNVDDMRHKEILINKWLKDIQTDTFNQICQEVYQKFKEYDIKYPVIKMRKMKSRWGSCQPSRGVITLNSRLIELPRKCIEYVVLHEFAHFIHPNHSKHFYDFVTKLMPDWKDRKRLLNNF